jgi:hypothetical protein
VVSLTAWNTLATHDTAGLADKVAAGTVVLAVKGVRASDFNGVSLSTIGKTVLAINPDVKVRLPGGCVLTCWVFRGPARPCFVMPPAAATQLHDSLSLSL